jgi:hypothetical protein
MARPDAAAAARPAWVGAAARGWLRGSDGTLRDFAGAKCEHERTTARQGPTEEEIAALFDLVRLGDETPVRSDLPRGGGTASAEGSALPPEWVTLRDIAAGRASRQQQRTRTSALTTVGRLAWLTKEAAERRLAGMDSELSQSLRLALAAPTTAAAQTVSLGDAAAKEVGTERRCRMEEAIERAGPAKRDLVELLHLGHIAPGKGVLQVVYRGTAILPTASLCDVDTATITLDDANGTEVSSLSEMYDKVAERHADVPHLNNVWELVHHGGRQMSEYRTELEELRHAAPVPGLIEHVTDRAHAAGGNELRLRATVGGAHMLEGVSLGEVDTFLSRLRPLWRHFGAGSARSDAGFQLAVCEAFLLMDATKRAPAWTRARCEVPFPWAECLPSAEPAQPRASHVHDAAGKRPRLAEHQYGGPADDG